MTYSSIITFEEKNYSCTSICLSSGNHLILPNQGHGSRCHNHRQKPSYSSHVSSVGCYSNCANSVLPKIWPSNSWAAFHHTLFLLLSVITVVSTDSSRQLRFIWLDWNISTCPHLDPRQFKYCKSFCRSSRFCNMLIRSMNVEKNSGIEPVFRCFYHFLNGNLVLLSLKHLSRVQLVLKTVVKQRQGTFLGRHLSVLYGGLVF